MTIEEKETNYMINKKLDGAKSVLMLIKNDFNNDSGAVSEDVISSALGCVIDYINDVQSCIEM